MTLPDRHWSLPAALVVLQATASYAQPTSAEARHVVPFIAAGASVQMPASRFFGIASGLATGGGIEVRSRAPIGLRAEGTAHFFMFGLGSEQPDCVPSAPCESRSMGDFVGIGSLSLRWRPLAIPVCAFVGADYLYAPRTSDSSPSATQGANAGFGTSIGRERKWSIEVRYHDPRRDLGLFRSLLDVTLMRAL